jgi:hypothetical protein
MHMSMADRGRTWLWGSVVAVALILLAGIMTAVIMMSARMRRPERQVVIQQFPVGGQQGPASASEPPVASTPSPPGRSTAQPGHGQPVRVVQTPVKVIEKQVKVIEREIRVVEKPVRGPAASQSEQGREAASGTFRATGLPNQLEYSGTRWNASDLVRGLPADLLVADRDSTEGWRVYHEQNTEPPYRHVYLKAGRRGDQYVRYVPTKP